MARLRSIKPEFWTSEQIMDVSRDARLMFVGLWNFCDDAGRHPLNPSRIKAEIFPGDDVTSADIRGWLDELERSGLIETYTVDDKAYLQVTGWHHQKIDHPQKPRYPQNPGSHSTNETGVKPELTRNSSGAKVESVRNGSGEDTEKPRNGSGVHTETNGNANGALPASSASTPPPLAPDVGFDIGFDKGKDQSQNPTTHTESEAARACVGVESSVQKERRLNPRIIDQHGDLPETPKPDPIATLPPEWAKCAQEVNDAYRDAGSIIQNPNAANHVQVWQRLEFTPELVISTIRERLAEEKYKHKNLRYFDAVIAGEKDRLARLAAEISKPPTPQPSVSIAQNWDVRLKMFKHSGIWARAYGPMPGFDGCQAPPEVQIKYGYKPLAAITEAHAARE